MKPGPHSLARKADVPSPFGAQPLEMTIAELFEQAASTYPERIAVVCGEIRWTYRELNSRANRLSRELQKKGVGPETMVGVCLERSPELILALVAILKAGGAYVPFDPEYPGDRLAFMIKDTSTPLVITQESLSQLILANASVPLILIDSNHHTDEIADSGNVSSAATPASLAYVMYTSGSTGIPKGVLIENRSVVRLVFETNYCQFGPDEVFLQFAPASFDASTLEIWGALLHGGKLVVMPPKLASLEQLGGAIREHGVTTLWLTAGLFHLFVDEQLQSLHPLKQLLAGGDVLSAPHIRRVFARLPHITIVNGYGPTEGTTFTCCHVMRSDMEIPDSVPIGKPISHTQVHILDENLRPVGVGEVGELCAGGLGVARGYLNAPELTSEKFVVIPSLQSTSDRVYRTGDLGRWKDNGTIEFLGRQDCQVKILGRRIELGEIEAILNQHPGISRSCVIARSDGAGSKRLLAYYIVRRNGSGSNSEIRDYVAARLPAYMVPAFFIQLTQFPLDPNGKVDRAALPNHNAMSTDTDSARPRSGLEQTITDLWKRVLNVESVGVDANFFDLGGDSLLLVSVHSQLQKSLHTEFPVTDLFEHTTVRTLAKHLSGQNSENKSYSAVEEQAQRQRAAIARMKHANSAGIR